METKQKSTAKKETSKVEKEVPRFDNAVFNHNSDEGMEGATGCSREHMDALVDKLNKGIMDDKVQRFSEAIEVIFKNTTHKELAFLFMQQHYQRNRDSVSDFMSAVFNRARTDK